MENNYIISRRDFIKAALSTLALSYPVLGYDYTGSLQFNQVVNNSGKLTFFAHSGRLYYLEHNTGDIGNSGHWKWYNGYFSGQNKFTDVNIPIIFKKDLFRVKYF